MFNSNSYGNMMSDKEEASRLLPLLRTVFSVRTNTWDLHLILAQAFQIVSMALDTTVSEYVILFTFTIRYCNNLSTLSSSWRIFADKLQTHFASIFRASLQLKVKKDPVEVCAFSRWDNVSISILSITERPSLSLRSFIRTPMGSPRGSLSPEFQDEIRREIRTYQVLHKQLNR